MFLLELQVKYAVYALPEYDHVNNLLNSQRIFVCGVTALFCILFQMSSFPNASSFANHGNPNSIMYISVSYSICFFSHS